MTQPQSSGTYKTFGIIALVLGILAFVFSFVPCLGIYAMYPGFLGVILGVVAFFQANKAGAQKGMIITALALSVVGTGVAVWQYTQLKQGVEKLDAAFKQLDKSMDSSKKALNADMQKLDADTKKSIDSLNNVVTPTEASDKTKGK